MKNRLILIEGIPGSGKTTISKKIKNFFTNKGFKVELYNEGDAHPADMAWNALLSIDEYNNIIRENKKIENLIVENSIFEENYVIVAYTKLGFHRKQNKLMNFFEDHEIYDGRASSEFFKEIHIRRWKGFLKRMLEDNEKMVIFECAFLQNHVNELLAMHAKEFDYIKEYLNELAGIVRELNPKLVYLNQINIKETINRVAKERVSSNKDIYPDWIDVTIEYFENSKYGKNNGLSGINGLIQYFEKRQEIELEIIKSLPIDNLVINNKNYDYKNVENIIFNNLYQYN
ncbi:MULTISPECIES: thymidylate kinase [unclassified Clostridium]|uniref:thymidylate kinase n=1 Tax=unclassified Clostridium TaxID=2614128 RepID=UPI000297DCD3|nr:MULTISPECIES: thymidylate kinase [unclassified Clostridium]EKQ58266.1 MAG: thymidylate kinase [Clostridium sp. Maddingley MBC34-26]